MNEFFIYEPSGLVVKKVSGDEKTADINSPGELSYLRVAEGLDPDYYYIEDGLAKQRQTVVAQLETEGLSAFISGLPVGLTVEALQKVMVLEEEGDLEVEFSAPGQYQIRWYGLPQWVPGQVEVTIE